MEKGGYSLGGVASRSAARSGGLLGLRGAGEAWGGSEHVVASIGLTEGKHFYFCALLSVAWHPA